MPNEQRWQPRAHLGLALRYARRLAERIDEVQSAEDAKPPEVLKGHQTDLLLAGPSSALVEYTYEREASRPRSRPIV